MSAAVIEREVCYFATSMEMNFFGNLNVILVLHEDKDRLSLSVELFLSCLFNQLCSFIFFFFYSCKENCALFFFTTPRFYNATEKFVFRPFCLRLFLFFRSGPNLEIAWCYLPFCVYFRGYSLVQARGTFHQIWEKRSYPGTFRCVFWILQFTTVVHYIYLFMLFCSIRCYVVLFLCAIFTLPLISVDKRYHTLSWF